MHFGKLVFESDEQEFSLRGVKSKKVSSHPGRHHSVEQRLGGENCLSQSLKSGKRTDEEWRAENRALRTLQEEV